MANKIRSSIKCVGLLISLPYLNLNSDEQTGIQNMQGLLYLIVTETIFTYTYSVFHTFPQEIPLLLREIGNGLYRPGPYYISKMIILIPRAILGPFIYTGLIFYIAGLQGGVTGFLLFCIPVISSAIAATAYGSVMSASFESVSTASLLSVPVDFISEILLALDGPETPTGLIEISLVLVEPEIGMMGLSRTNDLPGDASLSGSGADSGFRLSVTNEGEKDLYYKFQLNPSRLN
uniref:ABC-2 type transporter transmembrane domain-containing protein n=1 Tax=Timema genevievae TaxID=629358 RepID=A0A7R9JZ89_TIMGE|nr:unnamed protein product [Timema genevievae]